MARVSARRLALQALRRWRTRHELADVVLQRELTRVELPKSDRAFCQELFYGVLRNLTLLDFIADQLRSGGLDHTARDLVRLGLYQLFKLTTPEHAAVFETVELAPIRLRQLVNGILRSAIRQRERLVEGIAAAPLMIRGSHPQFLIERWEHVFGRAKTEALCRWNNQPPSILARINTLRIFVDEFFRTYPGVRRSSKHPCFVECEELPVEAIHKGHCYVQDPSTAAAVELLEPEPDDTILDACAAPGGKTGYMAALTENRCDITAVDAIPRRVDLLRENLARLGVGRTRIIQADWTAPDLQPPLTTREHYDKVLIDVPCTNTGVMRRRVDVRWRLNRNDFSCLAETQAKIARAVIPLLRRGGVLVYSTCSLEHEENEAVVENLLAEFRDLRVDSMRSVLPFRDELDGAFAARIRRGR